MDTIWRPMGTDDAAGLATLLAAAEAVDEFGEHYDEDDVREHFMADTIDLEHDTRVAVRNGTIVACGAVVGQVVMREVHTVWCSGVVDPGHRRQGIGRELLTWQLARAEELHRARFGGAPASLGIDIGEHHEGRRALARELGLEPVRHWFEMNRTLDGAVPDVVAPDGITIEPFAWDRDDEVRRAHNVAFRGHYGSTERTPQEWKSWFTGSKAFRPDLSVLALDHQGDVGGYALAYVYVADNVASGRNEVFLGQIGTLPSCRSTGAGRALLAAALAAWKAAGIDAASLGVDSENGTGALGLYERAGFAVTKRSSSWARQLGALTASDAT